MKTTSALIIVVSFFVLSCKDNTTNPSPSPSPNLITNSAFESNGSPSLQGWFLDIDTASVSSDVPPFSVGYSVEIFNSVPFDIYVRPGLWQNITPQLPIGKHVYRISCWGKRVSNYPLDTTYKAWGSFLLRWVSPIVAAIQPIDSVWRRYSAFTDSVDTPSPGTGLISVEFSAAVPYTTANVYFYDAKLELVK